MELNYKSAKCRGKAINVQVVIWQNNDIKYDVLLTLLSGNLNYRFDTNFLSCSTIINQKMNKIQI